MNARVGTPTVERGPSITGGAPKIDLSQMLGMDAPFLEEARAAARSANWSLTPTQRREERRRGEAAEVAAAHEIQVGQGGPRRPGPEVVAGQQVPVADGGLSADEIQRMHMATVAEVSTGGQARTRGATVTELSDAIKDGNAGRARVGQGSAVLEIAQLSNAAGHMFGDTGRGILGTLASPFANRVERSEPESEILRG